MTILIDFDQTLFDTIAYRSALAKAWEPLGVGWEPFIQAYHEAVQSDPAVYGHRISTHVAELKKILPSLSDEELTYAAQEVLVGAKGFLYPGAIEFLQYVRSQSEMTPILFSRADKATQEERVEATGIQQYFDHIFIDDKKKHEWVDRLLPLVEYPAYHINDNFQEMKELEQKVPQMKHLIKIGKHNRSRLEEFGVGHLPTFDTFEEIRLYLEGNAENV